MDIPSTAAALSTLLTPLLPYLTSASEKAVEEVGKRIGSEVADKVFALWKQLSPKLETRAAAKEALDDVVAAPEDDDVKLIFKLQLKKLLAEDVSFAQELAGWVETIEGIQQTATVVGAGAVAQQNGTAAGADALAVGGDVANSQLIVAKNGATVVIGEQAVTMTAMDRHTLLGRYVEHIISHNRYLQLQGIRSGGRLVNIELEHIYITLRATQKRCMEAEQAWLEEERHLAPGESKSLSRRSPVETVTVSVNEALAAHKHLVVLGSPGSGKTTLLRYLALQYAQDCAETGRYFINEQIQVAESGYLPILLPLRNLGAYLQNHYPNEDGVEGHRRLLEFLLEYLGNASLNVDEPFFTEGLEAGRVVVLLDGMDEVGDKEMRRRVARLIESFASAYAKCRVVVTSRVVGYDGAVRLGEGFTTTTVRDFSMDDVQLFLSHWHRLVAVGQMGPGEDAIHFAAGQTQQLFNAIQQKAQVRELAINPLMLTVIALVHRDRVELPDRRAELYDEAINVLLGKWDEARGVKSEAILQGRTFDAGDRRLLLQSIAFDMHERGEKEISLEVLQQKLKGHFLSITGDEREATQAVDRFLSVIKQRTGLLVEAGQGIYRFSHLTFQEYLAAVELAERDDCQDYLLSHTAESWWREVILLVAGYISTKHRGKVTRLIAAIVDCKDEPEPFHNMVLAAEAIRDVGASRVESHLAESLRDTLRTEVERPLPAPEHRLSGIKNLIGKVTGAKARRRSAVQHWMAAANALGRIESGQYNGMSKYWHQPHGEPNWLTIPAGEFWMGSDEREDAQPAHRLHLPEFQIAPTPVSNAQYAIFITATGNEAPGYWQDGYPPKGLENHPVVEVSWRDALFYCEWLSEATGQQIVLPSEAEWEKAARGDQDQRRYPWGDEWQELCCNSYELDLGTTTPVDLFSSGVSPYGCLDMAGNVWEWTRSQLHEYPYDMNDGREKLDSDERRVLRGGAFLHLNWFVRCAYRYWGSPDYRVSGIGFRVALSPFSER